MRWIKRGFLVILTLVVLFVGVVVVRTVTFRAAGGAAVPVEAGTEKDWEAPPFSGEIRDGYVYGRGAVDDKGYLVALMEAMETLLSAGFEPRRTVMLAFGHDEEVLGSGAKSIARLLAGMLDAFAPHLGFVRQAVLCNRWAFGPLLSSRIGSTPAGNAVLRTTIAPTELSGGTKENVLPQEVHALVNLRLNPRDSVESALEHLRRSVAGIDGIQIEIQGTPTEPSPVSSTSSESYALLAAAARAHSPEGATVAPMLVLGGTDSRYFAPIVENVYRFAPEWGLQSEFKRIHGTGERMSLENLGRMVRFFAQLVATGAR